jgi:hypothetical protein
MKQPIKNLGKSLGPRGRGPFTRKAEAGFGVSGQMGMKKLSPLAKAALLTVAIMLSYAANAAAETKKDLAVINGDFSNVSGLGAEDASGWRSGIPQGWTSIPRDPQKSIDATYAVNVRSGPYWPVCNVSPLGFLQQVVGRLNETADVILECDVSQMWGPDGILGVAILGANNTPLAVKEFVPGNRAVLVAPEVPSGTDITIQFWAVKGTTPGLDNISVRAERVAAAPAEKLLYTLDAQQPRAIQPVGPNTWGGVNPQGAKFVVTSQGLEIGGKPIVPVAGEMHPTRTNEEAWEESILKIKAGGLNTISFYVIWSHLEKEPGQFDFTGNRNIRKFVELCAKHGMYVWLRPGPFVNSEVLAGGLPQWLFGVPGLERSNDPAYLAYVKRYYGKLGEQLKGLMFEDGGPVIAVQPENELGHAPVIWEYPFPGAGYGHGNFPTAEDEGHLLWLKKMAQEAGMDAPLFTTTAWGGAPVPLGELLATSGVYSFLGAGAPTVASTFTDNYGQPPEFWRYPFGYVELGAGCPIQAEWRPIVPPESAEVTLLTRAACGGSMFCMYIYHGGTNPSGTRGPLNYDRWMPIMSYDWFAPIGEFGRLRDSYRALRPLANFLTGFPELITPTVTVWPGLPVQPGDTKNLRYVARIDGNRGFLFINNYQDKLKMPPRKGVRIEVKLKDEKITVPADDKGMDLAADAMAVLPLNLEMDGARLKYATAQLLARLDNDGRRTWVFFAPGGMSAEYAFEASSIAATTGATPAKDKGLVRIPVPEPGTGAIFEVTPVGGKPFSVLTLTRQQAVNALKSDKLWDAQRLVLSDNDILAGGDMLRVSAVGKNELSFAVYPPPAGALRGPGSPLAPQKDGAFARYALTLPKRGIKADIVKPQKGQLVVKIPRKEFDQLNDIFLRVDYAGDRGWAFLDSHLVTDNFNNGQPWEIGLKRWCKQLGGDGLFLRVVPWKTNADKIVFDGIAFRPTGKANEPAEIKSVTLVPEYAAEIRLP